MIEKCTLPPKFNMVEYLRAFRTLAPIAGITENMPDNMVTYTANCAFIDQCEKLRKSGKAKKEDNIWVVLNSERESLVHMNVLLIAIHSGASIAFVESFT